MGESEQLPLKGKRVVVTRAVEQAAELVEELKRVGAEPIIAPMIRLGEPADFGPLDAALRKIGEFDWILFTSRNAVKAVAARARRVRASLQLVGASVKVGVVGPATEKASRAAGFSVAHVANQSLGLTLVEDLRDSLKGKRVLLPRSDKADPELVKSLSALKAHVTEVVAYRTIPVGGLEPSVRAELEEIDAVIFFSPSAVDAFVQVVGLSGLTRPQQRCVIAAIGPVTEAALAKHGVKTSVEAEQASVAGVVGALTDFFRQHQGATFSGAKSG